MNHKQIAKEIYQESRKLPTSSEASRYRKKAISCFPQVDRVMISSHIDNLKGHRRGTKGNFGSEFYAG